MFSSGSEYMYEFCENRYNFTCVSMCQRMFECVSPCMCWRNYSHIAPLMCILLMCVKFYTENRMKRTCFFFFGLGMGWVRMKPKSGLGFHFVDVKTKVCEFCISSHQCPHLANRCLYLHNVYISAMIGSCSKIVTPHKKKCVFLVLP